MRQLSLIIIVSTIFLIASGVAVAQNNQEQQIKDIQNKINEYQIKLNQLRQQKNTLASQIQYMETQIYLTTLQITETEQKINLTQKEIEILGARIEGLDTSLDYLSKLLLKKIVEGYKNRSLTFLTALLDSVSADDFVSRIKYLKTAQENNQRLLIQVQKTKLNFEEQKKIREEKKLELDNLKTRLANQKAELNNQRAAKQKLLIQTQNDEQIYQELLAKAQAEYAAIQGIIAGAGTETKLREVRKGETIASLIPGASCNSSGQHLHFIVQQEGVVNNPFTYLKPVEFRNCSGSSCDGGDGDPFNPSGSWDWPLSPPIELEQGYGNTWGVRNTWVGRIYQFHNGIDINGSSNNVVAVADGTLYQGVYSVGCALSYVKLIHKDENMTTFYLHVYPP
jgi:peptidoglycan hydrolase CwlO-like protein